MLRNFESVLVTTANTVTPKPLKERSSSMRNIKPTTHSEEPAGFDRHCSTAQRLREFTEESLSKPLNGMFVMLTADDERQCEPILLQFCKCLIEKSQSNGQLLKLSIWDVGDCETDATTRSRDQITCYDVQFLSEVRRLLNRRQSNRREEQLRIVRFQLFRGEKFESEVLFVQVGETDSTIVRERFYALLTNRKGRGSTAETFFQQDHAIYLMLLASDRGRTKHNKHIFQFCTDAADRIIESNRRLSKKQLEHSQLRSRDKENINSASNDRRLHKERTSSGLSGKIHHPSSNPNLLEELDRQEQPQEDSNGRTMGLIAMKRKEGFDRLLLQLEQENRQLKLKITSQKNDFERQTEEYLQKSNRKVGRLKLQIDQLQESLRKCQAEKEELQAKLNKADERNSIRHEQSIVQLEKERTELRSELAYAKKTLELNSSEYDKQMKIYEDQLDGLREKIDSLQSANNQRLQELEQHLEQCLVEHSNLKQHSQHQEEQLKAAKQNESKYLEEISRLEYRFLKERGKYIAEKNNNQKLAHELQVMDDKLNQIIEIKNREITDLTDESSDCH